MNKKILLVDDDVNLLQACSRTLRRQFELHTASGGQEGLRILVAEGPFAVVVSDMRMPGMDGIEFLEAVKVAAPDSVRMMLTGNSDQGTAINAVNQGNVFRFMTKPCPADAMAGFLTAGIRQYELVTAEKQLLDGTLHGAVKVCTEILSAVDQHSYGQAEKVRQLVEPIAAQLGVENRWEVDVATLLAGIGNATIPPVVAVRHRHGSRLTGVEQDMLTRVPEVGFRLLANVPRLDGVARIVLYAAKDFDGGGFPRDDVKGKMLPLGSRIIHVVSDFVALEATGETRRRAVELLRSRTGKYDPEVLDVASTVLCPPPSGGTDPSPEGRAVRFKELLVGDLLTSNVVTNDGVLLIQAGTMLSTTMLERLRNFAELSDLREPILIDRRGARVARPVAAN